MGFVGSLFDSSKGAGFEADQNPENLKNLNEQYDNVQGAQSMLQGIAAGNPGNAVAQQNQVLAQQNAQQAAGLINSQKGINPALAARLGSQQMAKNTQGAASLASQAQLGAIQGIGDLGVKQQGVTQQGITSANTGNTEIQKGNQGAQFGLLNGAGSALGGLFAEGGMVPGAASAPAAPNAMSRAAAYLTGGQAPGNMFAHGGQVPAMVSPGEVYVPPSKVNEVARGQDPRAVGEKIPGKAAVKGNSFKNDTVPKTLESGGIVIPKSVMESKDPAQKAHEFVTQILAKKGLRGRR